MASAPSAKARLTPSIPARRRPWPTRALSRAALRVALGAPFAVLGVWAVLEGQISPNHETLIIRAQALADSGFSFLDLGNAYPPIPILLAITIGGSAVGLAVISSMLAGSAFHAAWESMVQRGVPVPTQLTIVASMALLPPVWYLASQDVLAVGGLAMLVVALSSFLRFTIDGETAGGFTAGLFMAGAFLFDPAALAYAFTLALVTPFLASARYFREPAATRALISVLCFPIVALLLGWAFLEWRFDGSAFAFVTSDLGLFQFEISPLADLRSAAFEVVRNVAFVPVYIAVAVLLVAQRPVAGLGFLIPIAGLVLVRWSGLAYSATATLVLLTLLAMVTVPSSRSRLAGWILSGAAVAQLLLNVVAPLDAPGFDSFLNLL